MSIKSIGKKRYANDIIIQDDIPVHEQMILENIQSGNNLLNIDVAIYKLKGKLEIIEILRELNMITDNSYNYIKKEALTILHIKDISQ